MAKVNHDPRLCQGCAHAGNVIPDPGVPGCTFIVQCGIWGTLTWGTRGLSDRMELCEHRVVQTIKLSKYTVITLKIQSMKDSSKRRPIDWSSIDVPEW